MAPNRLPLLLSFLPRTVRPTHALPPAYHLTHLTHRTPHPTRPLLPLPLPFHRPTHNPYSTSTSPSSSTPPSKTYTFTELNHLTSTPTPSRTHILIDVREPTELATTGRIPGAVSLPLTSNPDGIYLSRAEFYDRFGFEKPGVNSNEDVGEEEEGGKEEREENTTATAGHGGADPSADLGAGGAYGGGAGDEGEGGGDKGEGEGEGVKEVIFYCKAGVRSRAAARMAAGEGGWKGVRIGEFAGWDEWVGKGGRVER